MNLALQIVGTVGLAAGLLILFQARSSLRFTTLKTAWKWSLAALLLWSFAWGSIVLADLWGEHQADQLWYTVSVFMLCPFVAVLGAKRPGTRVWAWFILLPMILVLQWPAWVQGSFDPQASPVQLQLPAVIAYALVLLMGVGNYLGTRFTGSALLTGGALILLVAPLSETAPQVFSDRLATRFWATVFLVVSLLWAARQARREQQSFFVSASRFDRLWQDFRDYYGIVWAKRIQDRVNQTARKDDWPARLEPRGIVWTDSSLSDGERVRREAQIEHTFRWLLRRFADPEWINDRLPSPHRQLQEASVEKSPVSLHESGEKNSFIKSSAHEPTQPAG